MSPWVIQRAESRARELGLDQHLSWSVGDAAGFPDAASWDVVACLGASWIWDGFRGTVDALVARTRAGGRFTVGDVRLNEGADPEKATGSFGEISTRAQQVDYLKSRDLDIRREVVPSPASWEAYDQRVLESTKRWATDHAGELANEALRAQTEWERAHHEARQQVTWTIWIVDVPF